MNLRWTLAVILAASHSLLSAAAQTAGDAKSVPEDVAFCREVLILHHSHVDIGYTHPQSMYWELQKGYLDAALDMLDRTETWPDDLSRPRWTAEVTAPVVRWLQTAPAADVARLKRHVQSGRFGISGFEYNTTPLSSSEGLARQLYHVRTLREQLGADIRTVHQHDVTGLPWAAVDLLLDARIECLVMGINLHLSGTPMPRPAVYRWRGPSGRELLVMNGEHYSMFDQWCDTSSRNLETIQAGLDKYLRHVRSLDYPYDFVYLSATHAPYMYDNSPPNQDLPGIVRQWNEQGRHPRLRLVTPNELLARLRQIPPRANPGGQRRLDRLLEFRFGQFRGRNLPGPETGRQHGRHRPAAHLEPARLAHRHRRRTALEQPQSVQRTHLGRTQLVRCRQSVCRHAMASQSVLGL